MGCVKNLFYERQPKFGQILGGEDRVMKISAMEVCCWLILLTMSCSLGAQVKNRQEVARSPREFVEGFYKWYVPKALSDNKTAAWNVALKYKSSVFSRELAQLLREDSTAQARCEELVGLDFDPFLNSQDPATRYDVGGMSQKKDKHYLADIYSVHSGKRNDKPSVSAELEESDGHWIFVNFFYSDGTNLLTILKSPRPVCSAPRPSSKK